MKTIYKYLLQVADIQTIPMPVDAEILAVQVQDGTPCIWAIVEPRLQMATRTFRMIGTGHPAPDVESMRYVGTVQLQFGCLVFHVFEVRA